jgi:hypothetical protein
MAEVSKEDYLAMLLQTPSELFMPSLVSDIKSALGVIRDTASIIHLELAAAEQQMSCEELRGAVQHILKSAEGVLPLLDGALEYDQIQRQTQEQT